jgi:isochorismate synthase
MTFKDTEYKAITECLNRHVSFVAFMRPNDIELSFFSNLKGEKRADCDYFYVCGFSEKYEDSIRIPLVCDANQTLEVIANINKSNKTAVSPWRYSTAKEQYISSLTSLVEELKGNGNKVVISRAITQNNVSINWVNVAQEYFTAFPATFRCIYYTPETGAWIVATPEILLEWNGENNKLITMSLAGTRSISQHAQSWDFKNVEEHSFVTRYIVNCLLSMGLEVDVDDTQSLAYGEIEHLCTPITTTVGRYRLSEALDKLSPTPALAGFPREYALDKISTIEQHPRHCYGGYIGIADEESVVAYVNLRCVNFDDNKYCIYAGGGITASSEPQDEWLETEAKAKKLLAIITKQQKKS